MKKLLLLTLFISLACFVSKTDAQGTVLSPGDLAIIQYQSDNPDAFTFVTFVDLAVGTTIYFTDCGSAAGGTFSNPCGEGANVYVAPAMIPAGTSLRWNPGGTESPGFSSVPASSDVGLNGTGMNLSFSGDQITAFQDTDGAGGTDPSLNPTMLFILQGASTGFTGDPTDSNETSLPMGLTIGTTAIAVGSGAGNDNEVDNSVFNGTGYPFATVADARAAMLNPANWTASSAITDEPYASQAAGVFGNVLPVELTRFSGQAKAKGVELQWETASEKDNKYFAIEKSSDGERFSNIGYVEGNGNSFAAIAYDFLDTNPTKGWSYYRLKQVDFDGSYAYSNTIAIRYDITADEVILFPNPASNELNLEITDAAVLENNNAVTVQINSVTSQLVKEAYLGDGFSGRTSFDVSDLPAGVYFVNVRIGAELIVKKLVIE
ncbi:MAG: T9SS type A sorting domain-containing protein [Saprospiraceae bacterium]